MSFRLDDILYKARKNAMLDLCILLLNLDLLKEKETRYHHIIKYTKRTME